MEGGGCPSDVGASVRNPAAGWVCTWPEQPGINGRLIVKKRTMKFGHTLIRHKV